ncbi:MAG: efflux RND transporter periplasmic adaptor subunit [Parcubacteria group bacterium]|jgi:RND family efflux transporter MFP subunit
MFKRKTWIWIIVIAAITFGGYKLLTGKKATTTYTTEAVTRGNLAQSVSVTGKVVSNQQADLSFVLTGSVDSILVDVGDKVVKGQRLATIDRKTFPQQLNQARMDIKIQKETLRNMERNRNEAVYSKNQRNAQEVVIQKAEEAYSAVLRQMRDNALYAPVAGTIIKKNINLGEVVMAGETAFVIAKPEDLLLESNVPEVDIVDIKIGQKVLMTFDALAEDEVFWATVSEIDPAATVIQDVVYYRVKMQLASPDQRLKIGMTCNDDIVTANAGNVLMIPQRAVKKDGSKKYVEILKTDDSGESVERVYVETGISGDNGMIEVKNNLKEGEKVITFTKVN